MLCRETVVEASATDGPYQQFTIPVVDPWQIRLIVTE